MVRTGDAPSTIYHPLSTYLRVRLLPTPASLPAYRTARPRAKRGARAPSRSANYGDPELKASEWPAARVAAQNVARNPLKPGARRYDGRDMQRPVMNPNFSLESPSANKKARKPRFVWLRKILGFFVRLLMVSPFGKPKQFRNEDGSTLSRLVRGLT